MSFAPNSFSSPSERLRNLGLAIAFCMLAIALPLGIASWVFKPLLSLAAAAVGAVYLSRARAATTERGLREPVWGWWPPTGRLATPMERQTHFIKAARYYVVAFSNEAVSISPAIPEKRNAKRWALAHEAGEDVEVAHQIAFSAIREVEVASGLSVTLITSDRSFILDGWFNRFEGSHHEALRNMVDQTGLVRLNEATTSDTIRFVRPHDTQDVVVPTSATQTFSGKLLTLVRGDQSIVSCGKGANMFDLPGWH